MRVLFILFCAASLASAEATIAVRGIVHDPQHRPLAGAQVVLRSSSVSKSATSSANGEFQINAVPEGEYTIGISAPGFRTLEQEITVSAARNPVLHFPLELAPVTATVEVPGSLSRLGTQTSTVATAVAAPDLLHTPGADLTNSLAMITDFTPGASMVHDMLHIRGGHQVNWFLDGIPVINTNIAANVAPLINPKNVDELEIERGGFSSEYGDRTYGFFNVVTPSGFDRDKEGNLVLSAGNFSSTDDQLNFGSHTTRFAYYASVDANRSELGLAAPVSRVIHDQTSGIGGFLSLLFNAGSSDQFRWVVSLRDNHYQIPNDADAQSAGIRDLDLERDYLAGFHWSHTFSDSVFFTLSPYFHFNGAQFLGGPHDTPYILNNSGRSDYFGGRAVLQAQKKQHNARFGVEAWGQHDDTFFQLTESSTGAGTGGSGFKQTERRWAGSYTAFAEDQYKITRWLTLDLGLRLQHYDGLVNENAADPRLGAAIQIPKVKWVLHGYYAYYYQPPPLDSLAGPALQFAATEGFGFIPLRGERDIQHDIGLTIPVRAWSLDVDHFHTSARNFLDHDVIGDSGIFIPLTALGAIMHGTEVTLRSPRLWHVAQWRVAYSNQIARGAGPVTGGLLESAPTGIYLLDHDQRNTLSSVLSLTFRGGWWVTPAYQFGSGFLKGDGPAHLPPHSSFDLSIGKQFNATWTVSASAVNLGNTRYLLDTSNTFGGTHYVNPRQLYGEVRYHFRF